MEDICAICRCDIDNATIIVSCSHRFCYDCLKDWWKERLICPLCKEQFDSIKILSSNVIEKVEQAKKTVDNSAPDLECLDDKYFLGEIERLLNNSADAKHKLFNPKARQKDFDSYGNQYVTQVMTRLNSLKTLMKSDNKFNPNAVMQELNEIDHSLKLIWQGRSDMLAPLPGANQSNENEKRYGADDDYDDDEDDYDDYY